MTTSQKKYEEVEEMDNLCLMAREDESSSNEKNKVCLRAIAKRNLWHLDSGVEFNFDDDECKTSMKEA